MPRKAKLSPSDWGHAHAPDFSIPALSARHHDAAAQHYEEAARHQRQAAKLDGATHHDKASHPAHMAHARHLSGVHHAENETEDHLDNLRHDSREGKEYLPC